SIVSQNYKMGLKHGQELIECDSEDIPKQINHFHEGKKDGIHKNLEDLEIKFWIDGAEVTEQKYAQNIDGIYRAKVAEEVKTVITIPSLASLVASYLKQYQWRAEIYSYMRGNLADAADN